MALPVEEKRWLVLGIALNKVLAPVLRRVVKQEMEEHYKYLDKQLSCQATPCTLKTLTYVDVKNDTNFRHLKFENINQNKSKHGANKAAYDYSVNHPVDLAKLYLPEDHACFSAFDESFGVSASLLLLSHSKILVELHSQKSVSVQSSADVRKIVRNKWAHFNMNDWTPEMFTDCFSIMKTLVEKLSLPNGMKKHIIQELSSLEGRWDFFNKGLLLFTAA